MLDDIKKALWSTADKPRTNMDAAEYKHLVRGLIFVKYVSDTFATRRNELERRFKDPNDEYFLDDSELIPDELEDRNYYKNVNVFWVPESARWETLRAFAKQADIGKRIDDALAVIALENPKLKNILDKRYARAQLPDGKLGELVDVVSTIGFGEDAGNARDVLGQVYEYFLGQFVSAEGQESNPTTWRLAAMNLAIRGIDYNLGREPGDTFTKNQHSDLRADFILANPPFCAGAELDVLIRQKSGGLGYEF
jgi:type I restriction enzyme M protein